MTRSRVAIIAVILLVVIAGGITAGLLLTGSDSKAEPQAHYTYPKSAVGDILSSCGKRLKRKTCLCVVAAYETTMPYSTFQQLGRQGPSAATRAIVQTFEAKTAACPR